MTRMLVAAVILASAAVAAAEETRTLRMATLAPDGSAWARELKLISQGIEDGTRGRLRIRWIWGGIAGEEDHVAERIRKQQLDGIASGGMLCQRIAPSMQVLALPGVFQNNDEAAHVVGRLWPKAQKEARDSGYALLAAIEFGSTVLFSREPVSSMAEFRKLRWWRWHLDERAIEMTREMGLNIVPTPLYEASNAYAANKLDGFMGIPTAAIVFPWSTQARYFTDLRVGFITACLLVANRVFDQLSPGDQDLMRAVTAKAAQRMSEIGRDTDEKLLGGLFAKQGLKQVPVSESFRSDFFGAARAARARLGERLAPPALFEHVMQILADYRAEHAAPSKR
jgi:TRAP-type C4-dicarboxylate transport system substrate-binding protein